MSRFTFRFFYFLIIFSFSNLLDINECRQFQIDCGEDRTCFNTRGAYECIDIPCPIGYIRQNESDCLLKCYNRSSPCPHRRSIYIRHRFIAIPRLTLSNEILFSLPLITQNKNSITMIDKTNMNLSFPFILNGIHLQTNRTLMESNEYEFEIHILNNESNGKSLSHHRRRIHTIFIIRINVSPFHF
jgi:hemicentin